MVFQVSAMVRTLSKGEESTQALDDGVGPLPRDAVRRSLDDLDSRIRRARARQLRLSDVLRVARAGDPERRQRELMQAREARGNGLPQLSRELGAVEVLLAARRDVAAEERLGVPVAQERFPVVVLEASRPRLARLRRRAAARRDQDGGGGG